jgi:hypothetical protein
MAIMPTLKQILAEQRRQMAEERDPRDAEAKRVHRKMVNNRTGQEILGMKAHGLTRRQRQKNAKGSQG